MRPDRRSASAVELSCGSSAFTDLLPTGALLLLLYFADRIGFFDLFGRHFRVPLKLVDYTPLQKLQTLVCSLAVGCSWTKDINHKLRPYRQAAQFLGMKRFPDQSTINRFLHQLGYPQRRQLDLILELLLQRFGLWSSQSRVPLDIDSTGLMVDGSSYEFARKGHFPRQRGRRGYRLSVASTYSSGGSEILALFLDPANSAPAGRLWDCLYQAAEVVGSLDRIGLIRADAAFGSGPTVEELIELELPFILKGVNNQTALKFSRQVDPADWQRLDLFTRVCDLGPQRISQCHYPVRVVLIELVTRRFDRFSYSHLSTTLSSEQADAPTLFHSYNERQRIESLFKEAKEGLSITHLRTRRFVPIESFLILAAITFNLLVWFRHLFLAHLDLQHLGLCEITQKLMDIPAQVSWQSDQLRLDFPAHHPLTPALARFDSEAFRQTLQTADFGPTQPAPYLYV